MTSGTTLTCVICDGTGECEFPASRYMRPNDPDDDSGYGDCPACDGTGRMTEATGEAIMDAGGSYDWLCDWVAEQKADREADRYEAQQWASWSEANENRAWD